MALLEVEHLSAGYGIVQALFDLSFTVEAGEAVVILGANGAGKTTTLKAISGLLPCDGSIRLDGQEITSIGADVLVGRGIAHVPEGRGTIADLTVDDNLRAGAFTRRDAEIESDLRRWYEVFPRLAERRRQTAGSMSGGEQQMLAIARAFMSRPRLLLLDEPSQGLAPLVTREVFDAVAELVEGTSIAVLLVEQNANLALNFASRAYVLEAGRIVNTGTAEELRNDDSVRRAYLGS
jgi:branched-chain amino acid transport system ATP-binding protein